MNQTGKAVATLLSANPFRIYVELFDVVAPPNIHHTGYGIVSSTAGQALANASFAPIPQSNQIGTISVDTATYGVYSELSAVLDSAFLPPWAAGFTMGATVPITVDVGLTAIGQSVGIVPALTPELLQAVRGGGILQFSAVNGAAVVTPPSVPAVATPPVTAVATIHMISDVASALLYGLFGKQSLPAAVRTATVEYATPLLRALALVMRAVALLLMLAAIIAAVKWLWINRPGFMRGASQPRGQLMAPAFFQRGERGNSQWATVDRRRSADQWVIA